MRRAMAHSSMPPTSHRSPAELLRDIGRWLLDGAAWALGFHGPQDHPEPPLVGAQPFSGGDSRLRRRQRHGD